MTDSPIFSLLLLVTLIVLGSFAIGTHLNVRKGDAILKWLRQGLPLIGERTTMRWLGSSVMELKIAKANAPFRNTETLAVFEPRDVLILWLWSRTRGRRDLLIFRAQLNTSPKFELEAFDPKGWTTHHTERDVKKKNWKPIELGDPSLLAYHSGARAEQVKPLIDLATRAGGKLVRLSVHRNVPNLELHWLLPNPTKFSARELFLKIRQIADEVTQ
ncbi:hypothetical protein ANRL3_02323 [Anaerolineae bacterium]|nr:hypothetical protein ANRL3_02323 [Anaerolineae bacterium]